MVRRAILGELHFNIILFSNWEWHILLHLQAMKIIFLKLFLICRFKDPHLAENLFKNIPLLVLRLLLLLRDQVLPLLACLSWSCWCTPCLGPTPIVSFPPGPCSRFLKVLICVSFSSRPCFIEPAPVPSAPSVSASCKPADRYVTPPVYCCSLSCSSWSCSFNAPSSISCSSISCSSCSCSSRSLFSCSCFDYSRTSSSGHKSQRHMTHFVNKKIVAKYTSALYHKERLCIQVLIT